jgi:pyruvate dehydrogenase E2 component (dihydrolipoamide acetyltransferase)
VANGIYGLVIPKYGMVMTEGRISNWHIALGAEVAEGAELVDIETEKVANIYESPHAGILRRQLVADGKSAPIGSLFGVISSPEVLEKEIDAFIEQFQAAFSIQAASSLGPTTQVVDTPGGYIRFLKQGDHDERPIVLVHGFGGDLNSWLLNQTALAESHSVYAVDLPGHGGSVKNPHNATIDDLAKAIEEFLDVTELSGVHLVGHSLGGGVAATIASHRPEQVASLTLIAPIGFGKEINDTFIRGLIEADRRKEMQTILESLFYNPALVSREMTMNVLKGKRIDGAVECLRAIAQHCFGGGAQSGSIQRESLNLGLPMQVIWGLSDKIIPSEHAANVPQRIGVHKIEHAGHMVHMEKAAEVNKLLMQFIATVYQ